MNFTKKMQESSGKADCRTFGYARVSTEDQNLDMQITALERHGCDAIFSEKVSTSRGRRPAFDRMKKCLRSGDTIVIWKLDRLFRSLLDMLKLHDELEASGIHLHSIQDNLNTSDAMGKFIFHILASVAELERGLIAQRTKAGIAAKKARGEKFGGAAKIHDGNRAGIKTDILDTSLNMAEVAEKWKVTVSTLNNHFPGVRGAALARAGLRRPPQSRQQTQEAQNDD